jgi:hypothetical protein
MKPKQVIKSIITAIITNRPLFIWGPPGIGKTQMIQQVVKAINDGLIEIPGFDPETETFHLILVPCTLIDPVDALGLPYNEKAIMKWSRPELWPTDKDWKGIIFFDELNAAIPAVQVACYRPAETDGNGNRWIGTHKLPRGARIMAAGNRDSDRAVTHKMPTPLRSRFTHIEAETFFKDWLEWAFSHEIAPVVCAWIHFNPDMLYTFDPKSDARAYSVPRSVVGLSDYYKQGLDKDVEYDTYAGTVGEIAAVDFISFLRIYEDKVDPAAILADPENADIPKEAGTKYAICAGLAGRAEEDTFAAIVTYTERMGEEFTYLAVNTALSANANVANTQAFIEWASDHNDFQQVAA